MEEIFKDVDGYEGIYQVGNLGNIKSFTSYKKGGLLSISANSRGYVHVILLKDGHRKTMLVHRLVAIAFITNTESKEFVNHKNSIRTDNRVENLEWCTHSENMRHGFEEGFKSQAGEKNATSKLKDADIMEILRLLDEGVKPKQISRLFNLCDDYVYYIRNGKLWSHLTGIIYKPKLKTT